MPTPSSKHSALSGMMLAGLAFAFQTASDTIFKLLSAGHPAYQIIFINGIFALVPILFWTMATGGMVRLRTVRLPLHLARGSASVMSAFTAIYAYSRLPLTDYYAIVFAGPLIVTVLSAFWLGEKVEPMRWLAIAIGFAGIMIVADPLGAKGMLSGNQVLIGRFAALISVLCYSLSVIMVRRMRMGESNIAFAFYGYMSAIVICGALFWFRDAPVLSLSDILHLAISGILSGICSICMLTAYHRTPVALVAPFQYTQIIWGAIAGYFLWAHLPDLRLVIGASVIAASGLFVIYREIKVREG